MKPSQRLSLSRSSALIAKLKLRREAVSSITDNAAAYRNISSRDCSSTTPRTTCNDEDAMPNDSNDGLWRSRSLVFALDDEIDALLENMPRLQQGECACHRCMLQSSMAALAEASHIASGGTNEQAQKHKEVIKGD